MRNPEQLMGMSIVPRLRTRRVTARPRRVDGKVSQKPHSTKGILRPPAMDATGRIIRTGLTERPYIPKDKGRAERLIEANRKINEERSKALDHRSSN